MVSFAKGVSSGYLPLGGIMVSKAIKQAMDEVKPDDRWMHAYTYSGHPTCCAVGLKNIEIMERERLWERAAAMGTRLHEGLEGGARRPQARRRHPRRQGPAGGRRAGGGSRDQGALRRRQEDRAAGAPGDEQARRGHARSAEHIFFAPPLVVTEAQVDQLVSSLRDAIKAVTGS